MATQAKILVVVDDPAIRILLYRFLSQKYQIEAVGDGRTALAMFEQFNPDLVIMDVNLPDAIGYNLCQQMKSRTEVFVMILLSCTDIKFEGGADDYLKKSFTLAELGVRVAELLKRQRPVTPAQTQRLVFNQLAIDPVRREVTLNDQPIVLTTLEFDLLHFLASNPGRVWGSGELIQKVWESDYIGEMQVPMVAVHSDRVRKKIEIAPTHPKLIKTVRGVGYKFELPTTTQQNPNF